MCRTGGKCVGLHRVVTETFERHSHVCIASRACCTTFARAASCVLYLWVSSQMERALTHQQQPLLLRCFQLPERKKLLESVSVLVCVVYSLSGLWYLIKLRIGFNHNHHVNSSFCSEWLAPKIINSIEPSSSILTARPLSLMAKASIVASIVAWFRFSENTCNGCKTWGKSNHAPKTFL